MDILGPGTKLIGALPASGKREAIILTFGYCSLAHASTIKAFRIQVKQLGQILDATVFRNILCFCWPAKNAIKSGGAQQ